MNQSGDARQYAPSTARNREPIFELLKPLLPQRGVVLEIASGAGEHISGLAQASWGGVEFQPSDPNPEARRSIDAWTEALDLRNVRPAIAVDASTEVWPIRAVDLVFCINMIHISPWSATVGLVKGAALVLPPDGVLFTYGPYRRGGRHTSPGNQAFDASLRQRNPEWGIRDVEAVAELAGNAGFTAPELIEMPANNLSLVFRRMP